ncbi:hypothetical protein [Streptomyces erythrochromogenes]|uniref:hypothetical protein n=1 Tax=Streptomyces erythrochromogenes TaxID=285574 RepID=UPI0036C34C28
MAPVTDICTTSAGALPTDGPVRQPPLAARRQRALTARSDLKLRGLLCLLFALTGILMLLLGI